MNQLLEPTVEVLWFYFQLFGIIGLVAVAGITITDALHVLSRRGHPELCQMRWLIQYQLSRFYDFIFHLFGIIRGGGVWVVGIAITEVLRHFLKGRQFCFLDTPLNNIPQQHYSGTSRENKQLYQFIQNLCVHDCAELNSQLQNSIIQAEWTYKSSDK